MRIRGGGVHSLMWEFCIKYKYALIKIYFPVAVPHPMGGGGVGIVVRIIVSGKRSKGVTLFGIVGKIILSRKHRIKNQL